MVRILLAVLLILSAHSVAAWEFEHSGILDVQLPINDGSDSWLNEGLGKLSYGDGDDRQLQFAFAGADLGLDITTQHGVRASLIYSDRLDGGVKIAELYYQFRPVSLSNRRYQLKIGSFFPAISFENTGTAWTSPYSLTASVMNSWIQEEIRATGIQFKTTWLGRFRNSLNDISLTAAVLWNNDPAGAILSWRGWAGHDLINGLDGSLPAAPLPFMLITPQVQKYEPFLELDDRPGGYLQVDLSRKRWQLLAAYYLNTTEPDVLIDGQYSWRTRFFNLGARWHNENGLEIMGQWLEGDTKMESVFFRNAVVNDFNSQYLLIRKAWLQQALLLRVERFRVKDMDQFPRDDNNEQGNSITIGYNYNFRDHWKFSLEGTRVDSTRNARAYLSQAKTQIEAQMLVGIRYQW